MNPSIYESETCAVPLAEIQHIEKLFRTCGNTKRRIPNGLHAITKMTHYDMDVDAWSNPIYISQDEAADFLTAWRNYRTQIDQT